MHIVAPTVIRSVQRAQINRRALYLGKVTSIVEQFVDHCFDAAPTVSAGEASEFAAGQWKPLQDFADSVNQRALLIS